MAQEHLNEILTEAGLEQADIEAILALNNPAADAAPEVIEAAKKALEPFRGKVLTTFTTKVKNDPKFWEGLDENNVNDGLKKKIEAQQFGRASNIVRQKTLKALGLKEEDLSDLQEEDKNKLEVYISKAAEKFASTKVTDKQLQQELLDTRKKYEELEGSIPTKEQQIKDAAEQGFTDKAFDFLLLAELSQIENLPAPARYLVKQLSETLKEQYNWEVKDFTALPKQKANAALDVIEGSKVLTLKDLLVKQLTADKLLTPKTQKKEGEIEIEVEGDGKGGMQVSSHIMEKIAANLPKEK